MTYPFNGNFGATTGRGKGVCVGATVAVAGKIVGVPNVGVGNGRSVAVAGGAVTVGNIVGAALGALVGVGSGGTFPQPTSPAHKAARVINRLTNSNMFLRDMTPSKNAEPFDLMKDTVWL